MFRSSTHGTHEPPSYANVAAASGRNLVDQGRQIGQAALESEGYCGMSQQICDWLTNPTVLRGVLLCWIRPKHEAVVRHET